MAKEPDDLVVKMLRDIRATLEEDTQRLEKADKRFDRIDKRRDDMSESLTYSLGIAKRANVRHETVQKTLEDWKCG